MSRWTLVRHAQASFFAADYDRLSAQGEAQARALAAHWLDEGRVFDEVWIGPRSRHRETAAVVGEAYRAAGRDWPEADEIAGLDEHSVDRLVALERRALADRFPELRPLADSYDAAAADADRARAFQRLFEAIARRWARGEAAGSETYAAFRARVHAAIERVLARPGAGRRAVAFTSVGPISVILGRALRCPDEVALETGWRLWNASVTELVFSGSRVTLDVFNSIAHLPHASDRTYR
jgi:broad specificity phosphatase PhoE